MGLYCIFFRPWLKELTAAASRKLCYVGGQGICKLLNIELDIYLKCMFVYKSLVFGNL